MFICSIQIRLHTGYGYLGSQHYGGPGASQGAPFHGTQFTSMPHAGGTLGKYVVHNFICLCFMVEGSYVIIYTQDHNSSPERGRLRITLCRHQEDMKEFFLSTTTTTSNTGYVQ